MGRKRRPTIAARQPKSTQGVRIQLVSNLCEGSQRSVPNFRARILSAIFALSHSNPLSNNSLPYLLPTSDSNLVCLSSSGWPPLAFSLNFRPSRPKKEICDRSDLYLTSSRMKSAFARPPTVVVVLKSRVWPCYPC
jgi:hypothetical protein